ncbi:MAG: F0F1 ATP synthase subunit B' [Rhodospirillaceae bacterium]|nr:F0F1 ATP synthase subunit B' [Rhodospirillaceae bacterium]
MRIANKAMVVGLLAATLTTPASLAMAAGGGLPQLDLSTYSSQAIWLVISFIALYALMNSIALPRIGEVLEERQNRIDDNLSKAENLKAQADAAIETYEKSLLDARTKAFDAIREVKDKAATEAHDRQSKLTAELGEKIKQAESEISKAKIEALSGIEAVAIDVASAAIAKLINEPANENSVSSAVSSALKNRT